ncbi:hypothetical protein AB1N83_002785 [Pleurotus pulmonarius]
MLHSISDLTTFCRKTIGDVPAKLVGASTTVVGSKMYLFGGRLVTERRMVSDMYVFDLATFRWEKIPPNPEDDVPRARYFHSADTWNNQLIVFGGMSNRVDSPNPDDLCVLNDVRFFDIATRRWLPSSMSNSPSAESSDDSLVPRARYAHLSSVTSNRLFIIGGQDFFNVWLDDVCVYDLVTRTWTRRRDYPRHCGTYRSVAVSSDYCVRLPQEELRAEQGPTTLGQPGTRFKTDNAPPTSSDFTASESLVHLPYSATPSDAFPSNIYLYSNYNFTDVKRELEVFYPLPNADFTIQDRSAAMTGTSFPPGLRFPTGAILGTHLIIAGTYLAHTYQSFSIWALDLINMTWSRIDPGSAVSTGSWFRGCLWTEANKFLIFGNRDGNLVDDYNRRLLSWDHVAVVDLEAFGIYQPPKLRIDIASQELGLAALEERIITDFEIICDDGRKIPCSRKILEERWPWFKEERAKFTQLAKSTAQTLPNSPMHVPQPDLPGKGAGGETRPDPRLTPRSFHLSEPYPITLALLQYFYSLALITPLQHAPAVLSQLLVLSSNYNITHLQSLVKHAMHKALSNSTSVGVYEVATLCSCRSLQIRALKTVMSYSQKRPSREKGDKGPGSGDGRPPGSGGNGGNGRLDGGPKDPSSFATRPRGTSDAHWRGPAQGDQPPIGSTFSLKTNVAPRGMEAGLPTLTIPGAPGRRPSVSRRISVLSTNTEYEISEVAELMSPSLVHATSNFVDEHSQSQLDEPEDVLPISDYGLDAIIEMFYDNSEDEGVSPSRGGGNNFLSPVAESFGSPTTPSSRVSSLYWDSDVDEYDPPRYPRPTGPGVSQIPFHLPTQRSRPSTARSDSDTPSLSSSASMSSLASTARSQPYSPRTPTYPPITPDIVSSSTKHLEIIEERLPEDQEILYRLPNHGPNSPTAVRVIPPLPKNSVVPAWPKKKSNVEWFKDEEPSFQATAPLPSARSFSSSPIPPSPPPTPGLAPSPRFASMNPLSRFKSNVSAKSTHTIKSAKSQPDFGAYVSGFDPKMIKAEEKKKKKAEAKARVERLAQELKDKNKKQPDTTDRRSLNSDKSSKKEQAALFGGLSGLVM